MCSAQKKKKGKKVCCIYSMEHGMMSCDVNKRAVGEPHLIPWVRGQGVAGSNGRWEAQPDASVPRPAVQTDDCAVCPA